MRIILTALLSLLLCHSVAGQKQEMFVIKGQALEEGNKEPLAYATVVLVKVPFTETILKGVVADENGRFELVAPKDNYNLVIRHLGYRNFVKKLSPDMESRIDLGTVMLPTKEEMLGYVTVKPLVDVTATEITYDLAADPDRETASLHDILDKVPMIKRGPTGNLYVNDPSKTFLVVRNGKQDALFNGNINDLLKSIPAKGFATVTVMLAPPERFGEYDYVVNITTDKNARLYGAVGNVKVDGSVSDGRVGAEAGVTASLNKMRVNVGGTYETVHAPKMKNTLFQQQTANGSMLHQKETVKSSGDTWGVGGMVSQDISKEHFMNWRLHYKEGTNRNKSHSETRRDEQEAEVLNTLQKDTRKNWGGGLAYQYDIGTSKQVLNAVYQFSLLPQEKEDSGQKNRLETEEKNHEQTLQVHYYNPLKKGFRLEAGCSYIFRDYFQEIATDGIADNGLDSRKHIINAYGALSYNKRRFSASAKLKMDYLNDGNGALLTTNGVQERISVKGIHFLPDLSLNFSFPKSKMSHLSLNYKLTHFRPSLRMLSVYEDRSNPEYIKTGNPQLKEEDEHILSLSTNIGGWFVYSVWMHSGNRIGNYWYQDEQQRLVQTYANQMSYNSFAINTRQIFRHKQWSFHLSGGVNYYHIRMAQEEKNTNWTVHLDVDANRHFKKGWLIGATAYYYDVFYPRVNYAKYTKQPLSLAIYAKKEFMKNRGEFEIRYHNLLHHQNKTEQEVNTDDFYMIQKSEKIYIPLTASLKIRIGSFKIRPTRQIRKGAVIDDVATE